MPQLSITITINVPDNKDDANKLVALLHHADNQIATFAQECIQKYDTLYTELNNALEPPRPAGYTHRINAYHHEANAWNWARMEVQKIIVTTQSKAMELLQTSHDQPTPQS